MMKSFFNQSDRIDTFEVVTLRVSTMRNVAEYEIVMKDGKAEVSRYSIRFTHSEDERVLEKRVEVDEAYALKLLNDCGVLAWDGFHGSHPRGVTDGTMFNLHATVNGGKKIYATGSQNFPRHYRDLTDGLYEILNN